MKPYDIYNLWVIFDKATTDPAFSTEQRLAFGRDMLLALPSPLMCPASEPSLTVVKEAMEGRLNEYSRSIGKTGHSAGTSPLAGSEGSNHPANAGDGVPLAGLGDSPKPPRKAKEKGSLKAAGKPE